MQTDLGIAAEWNYETLHDARSSQVELRSPDGSIPCG